MSLLDFRDVTSDVTCTRSSSRDIDFHVAQLAGTAAMEALTVTQGFHLLDLQLSTFHLSTCHFVSVHVCSSEKISCVNALGSAFLTHYFG